MSNFAQILGQKRAQVVFDIPTPEDSLISVVAENNLYRKINSEDDPDEMLHASTLMSDAYINATKYGKCVFLQNEIELKGTYWIGSLLEKELIEKIYGLWVLYRVTTYGMPDTSTAMSKMAATLSLNRVDVPFINITRGEAQYLSYIQPGFIRGMNNDISFVEVKDKYIIFKEEVSIKYYWLKYNHEYLMDFQSGDDKLSLFKEYGDLLVFQSNYPKVKKIGILFRKRNGFTLDYQITYLDENSNVIISFENNESICLDIKGYDLYNDL